MDMILQVIFLNLTQSLWPVFIFSVELSNQVLVSHYILLNQDYILGSHITHVVCLNFMHKCQGLPFIYLILTYTISDFQCL